MKRMIPLILAVLLLCGCASETAPEESTVPPPSTEATQATEPIGYYDPQSSIEDETDGAVRAYPLDITGVNGILPIGNDLLVFSANGAGTILTRLTGDQLYPAATAYVSGSLTPEDPSLSICGNSLAYFDADSQQTIVLDASLKEVRHIPAPEGMVGTPILSPDQNTLYYCTATSVRAWNLETGIRRILKEMAYPTQFLTGLFLNNSILQCYIADETDSHVLLLSTQTGEILHMAEEIGFTASDEHYYATISAGASRFFVFGTTDDTPLAFYPEEINASCWLLENDQAAVTLHTGNSGEYQLSYYDLGSGMRTSVLTMPEGSVPWYAEEASDGVVYILSYQESRNQDILYLWDTAALPTGDATIYTGIHYTADAPDLDGIVACQLYAEEIASRYGIEILVYEDAVAVQPWDYDLDEEYLVPVIQRELELLEQRLTNYPDGMLQTLAERFDGLNICLVRQLTGTAESGSLATATGIQFMDDQTAYIALAAGETSEYALYHEMCHLIDTMILTQSSAYDTWESLNPSSFEYDYSYLTNAQRDGGIYLQDGIRAFVDVYSMSFPKEDRARIMEYAMTEGHEDVFRSDTMQAKLKLLCTGIRDAFGLKKSPDTFLWEQYLEESLAYTE